MSGVRNQYMFHTGEIQECDIPKQAPIVSGSPAFTGTGTNTNCSSSPSSNTGCAFLAAPCITILPVAFSWPSRDPGEALVKLAGPDEARNILSRPSTIALTSNYVCEHLSMKYIAVCHFFPPSLILTSVRQPRRRQRTRVFPPSRVRLRTATLSRARLAPKRRTNLAIGIIWRHQRDGRWGDDSQCDPARQRRGYKRQLLSIRTTGLRLSASVDHYAYYKTSCYR
jgi:hypothetical protein